MTENKNIQVTLHCLKTMLCTEHCEECLVYGETGTDHCEEDAVRCAIKALEEVQEYRALGTVEEFRALKEKNEPKRINEDECCPVCLTYGRDDNGVEGEYCPNCGQKLDWE